MLAHKELNDWVPGIISTAKLGKRAASSPVLPRRGGKKRRRLRGYFKGKHSLKPSSNWYHLYVGHLSMLCGVRGTSRWTQSWEWAVWHLSKWSRSRTFSPTVWRRTSLLRSDKLLEQPDTHHFQSFLHPSPSISLESQTHLYPYVQSTFSYTHTQSHVHIKTKVHIWF